MFPLLWRHFACPQDSFACPQDGFACIMICDDSIKHFNEKLQEHTLLQPLSLAVPLS
jgi:hypothetical protein